MEEAMSDSLSDILEISDSKIFSSLRYFSVHRCIKGQQKDVPNYKKEHSLFCKELLLKLEEFRLQRSNWIASTRENQMNNAINTEGLSESHTYKGRCVCLRKMGFKTTKICYHFKTVRPLRFFTLKQKVSDTALMKPKKEPKERHYWWEKYCEESDSLMDQLDEIIKLREKMWDEKEQEIREKVEEKGKDKKKKKGPSRKALQNLQAARHAGRQLQTCRCMDGKEVTVVIKGFCLCDKGNLKKLKLNRIGDEYNRVKESKSKARQEEIEPGTMDSLDIHRHRMSRKSILIKDEDRAELEGLKIKKSVSFGQIKAMEEEKEMERLQQERRERGIKEEHELREREKKAEEQRERMRKKEEEERKQRKEEERREREKRDQAVWESKLRREQEQMQREQEHLKKAQEEKEKTNKMTGDEASIVTLFKNKPQKESEMGLTKEQLEKMKNINK